MKTTHKNYPVRNSKYKQEQYWVSTFGFFSVSRLLTRVRDFWALTVWAPAVSKECW